MQDHCGHAPHQKHVAPARRRCGRTLVGAVLACAVALLLLPLGSASAQPAGEGAADSAASAEKRVVRVGFPVQPGLTEIAEDGTRSGYTYDYLQEVAQYTGWEFEYVDYEGTDDEQISAALDDLMAGRIDVLGAMSYSKDLEELFDYPVHSYGHTYTVLFAPIGEDRISASTIDRINPLRVATWKNSVFRLADFESYASLVNLSYELVPCEGGLEVFETLEEGKADVGLGVGVSVPDGFRTVLRFTPRPFYFATPKASGLADDLDLVLDRIEQSEPTFASELFSHYFPEDGSMLEFSDTERACIENAGTLRVGLFPNRAPMSSVDPGTGEMTGATVDMLDRIAATTGLSFEYVALDDSKNVKEQIAELDLDVVAGIDHSLTYAKDNGLSLTMPFSSARNMIAFNGSLSYEDLRADMVMAAPYERKAILEEQGYRVNAYPNMKECLDAVDRGEADFTYDDMYLVSYYLAASNYKNVKTADASFQETRTCFGLLQPIDPNLLSVFNKGIQDVSSREMASMVYAHSFPERTITLGDLVAEHPGLFALVMSVPFVLVVGGLALFAFTRAQAAKRDSLTQLYNSAAFRKRVEKSLGPSQRSERSLLVIDIDDFKKVNDRFGHYEGDCALKAVANALKAASSGVGFAGRLGGDEFLAFWSVEEDEAVRLSEKLLDDVTRVIAEHDGLSDAVTVSIGIAHVRPDESYDDLYRRADGALYEAKHKGKHLVVVAR